MTLAGNCPHYAGMQLIDRLVRLAELWAQQSNRSLSRLATVVANDGKLFERIAAGGSCTLATFERFLNHLDKPENWPASVIPDEALDILRSVRIESEQEAA